mgnify:CR=1 FL=1
MKVHSFVLTASTSTFFCLISLEYLRISSRCLSTVSFNFVKTSISFSSVSENTKNKLLTLNLPTLRNINYITIVVINWCHRAREFHLNYNPDRCFLYRTSEQMISVMYFFSCLLYPLIGRTSGESGNVYALWHVGTKSETWIQKQYSPECLLIIWPGVGEMHGNLVWLPVLVCPNT